MEDLTPFERHRADQNIALVKTWIARMTRIQMQHRLIGHEDGSPCGAPCSSEQFALNLELVSRGFLQLAVAQVCMDAAELMMEKLTPDQAAVLAEEDIPDVRVMMEDDDPAQVMDPDEH